MFAMFDLPVTTRQQQRQATGFRKLLLDEGYNRKQFSVYIKYFDTREKADASTRRIGQNVPAKGMLCLLTVTDKQFGQMQNYYGNIPKPTEKKPEQLVLL